ncbi:MAG TPA: PQQ-binding-like beta-propeller repeat protein, partial [Actinomycetota bacterium]|nr:PQQ-binding-like beta-propeller repeat protein [Actinomycetota bacterium]
TPERVKGLAVDVLTHARATSSADVAAGHLFAGMGDGTVRSIRLGTGHQDWSFQTGGPVRSTPALVRGARIRGAVQDAVVVGSDDGRVYALRADTGARLWRFQTAGPVRSSPLVLPDLRPAGAPSGLVVVGSNDGHLYALSLATGAVVWMADMGGQVVSSPVESELPTIGASAEQPRAMPFVAVGSTDGTIRAFDAITGGPIWSRDLGGKVVASPMVLPSESLTAPGCDGLIAASTAGRVFGLACGDGHKLWSLDVGAPVVGSPALFTCPPTPGAPSCRDVVVGTTAGRLWAIDTAHPTAADSIWMDLGFPIRSAPAVAAGIVWVHTSPTNQGAGTVQGWLLVAKQRAVRIQLPTEPAIAHPPTGTSSSPAVADAQVLLPNVKLFISSDWPRFHHDTASTGFNGFEWKLGTNNVAGLHLLWMGPEAGFTNTRSSPAVANGVAYVGAENGKLYAFPASCTNPCSPLWTGQTDDAIVSTPAVANGVVYVGSRDTKLYAFPASCSNPCSPLWTGSTKTGFTNPAPITSSPVVANGVVYVGALGGNLFAFPASCSNPCSFLWHHFVNGGVSSSPAVAGGKVFVGGVDGRLYAFPTSCSDPCSPDWTSAPGASIESSPAVANGVVYVGRNDGRLQAYPAACSSQCQPLWTATMAGEIGDGPAVAKGVVYVGSHGSVSSSFSAFPTNCSDPCSPLWSADVDVTDSPAVANGVVYV